MPLSSIPSALVDDTEHVTKIMSVVRCSFGFAAPPFSLSSSQLVLTGHSQICRIPPSPRSPVCACARVRVCARACLSFYLSAFFPFCLSACRSNCVCVSLYVCRSCTRACACTSPGPGSSGIRYGQRSDATMANMHVRQEPPAAAISDQPCLCSRDGNRVPTNAMASSIPQDMVAA